MNPSNLTKLTITIPLLSFFSVSYAESKANFSRSGYCYSKASFVVNQADILFEDGELEDGTLEKLTLITQRSKQSILDFKVDSGETKEEASEYVKNIEYRLDDEKQKDKESYAGLGKSVSGDIFTNCQIFLDE